MALQLFTETLCSLRLNSRSYKTIRGYYQLCIVRLCSFWFSVPGLASKVKNARLGLQQYLCHPKLKKITVFLIEISFCEVWYMLHVSFRNHHYHHMLDPVLSTLTELAGFRMVIDITMPRQFVRSHASSFTSPFFFISFSACFFHVYIGLPLLPLTSNFKAFTVTFSSSFLK